MAGASRNLRGSSHDRRRRRERLVEQNGWGRAVRGFAHAWVACHWCKRRMRAASKSWEVDRHPVCGHDGGRYVRGNVVISCPACNGTRCRKVRSCRYKGTRRQPCLPYPVEEAA